MMNELAMGYQYINQDFVEVPNWYLSQPDPG